MRKFAAVLSFLVLFNSVGICNHKSDKIIKINSERQCFFDRFIVESIDGQAELKMHTPIDRGAVLKFDKDWEGKFSGYVTVIRDGDKYRLYYRGCGEVPDDYPKTMPDEYTCYAESSDGINWQKPELGICEFNSGRENNIILANESSRVCHNFSPFLDANPNVDSDQRYKAIGGTWQEWSDQRKRLYAYSSADGIHWKAMRDEPVFTKVGWYFDSQNVVFFSKAENCYVMFYRAAKKGVRSIGKAVSEDFITWVDKGNMKYSDTGTDVPSCQLYTNQTHPYYRCEQIYIAAAARFFEGRQVLTDSQAKQIGVHPKYFKDTSDSAFMTTRPGSNAYDRTFMSALIAPGIGAQNWVSRSNYPALNIVQTSPTEMSLYVNQDYAQDTAHLRRYSFRIDGIASLRAEYGQGEMLTRPFVFTGDRLWLNFATSAAGSIKVEIQDASGAAIEGFALKDARLLIGNEIERVYDWGGRTDLGKLQGTPVRLRFVLKDADLFSFIFKKVN